MDMKGNLFQDSWLRHPSWDNKEEREGEGGRETGKEIVWGESMVLLNATPLTKGVGKGYLPHPSPERSYYEGTLEAILKCVLLRGTDSERTDFSLRKAKPDCGLGSLSCLEGRERRQMACMRSEARHSCWNGEDCQDRWRVRVQTWTGLSLGPIQKGLEGQGTSADSSCEQTGDVLGRQGALPVRKTASCPEAWELQGKGPCKKKSVFGTWRDL